MYNMNITYGLEHTLSISAGTGNTTVEEQVFNYNASVSTSNGTLSNATLANWTDVDLPEYPRYFLATSTVFFVVIFILGVFGNALVIAVVFSHRNMKTAVNVYLVNLCVADFLVLILCMPTAFTELYSKDVWYFGEAMCKMVPFFENTVANASVLTILAISMERYKVVCEPLKGIGEDLRKVGKNIILIWLISCSASIPTVYIAVLKESYHLDGTPIVVCRNPVNMRWRKIYVALLSTLFFALPFSILLVLYGRVGVLLYKKKRNGMTTVDVNDAQHYKDRKRLRFQVINLLASIVVLFFICHLPFRVIGLWLTFENKDVIYGLGLEKYVNILYSGRIMFYLNHAVNPIIYNFFSTKFRSALRMTFMGKRRFGSYRSSNNRRRNNVLYKKHPTKSAAKEPEQCRALTAPNKDKSSSPSSSARQNRNEFFPMYAHIIEGANGLSANKDCDQRCSLHIRFIDKSVAVTFNLRETHCCGSPQCWCA